MAKVTSNYAKIEEAFAELQNSLNHLWEVVNEAEKDAYNNGDENEHREFEKLDLEVRRVVNAEELFVLSKHIKKHIKGGTKNEKN